MRKPLLLTFLTLLAISFWNCEKDDICADGTPTTPNIVIEFYDAVNTGDIKTVNNLGVKATGETTGFSFTGVSKITFPLKTFQDTTTIQFIENGGDADTSDDNIDEIVFNYTRNEIYISRACGYKTTFDLNTSNGAVLTNDADNWINNITIEQPSITNENETHIKIYF